MGTLQWEWDPLQIWVFIAATLSSFCAIILILTFYGSKKWRNELYDMKKILLALSCYNLVYCLAYIHVNTSDNDLLCRMQASTIQFFGVGSVIYEAILSVECFMLHYIALFGVPEQWTEASKREFPPLLPQVMCEFLSHKPLRRHGIYHIGVAAFGLISVIVMNSLNYYGRSNKIDTVCWINNNTFNLLFGVVPMALSIVVVITLNLRLIHLIISAFGKSATDSTIQHTVQSKNGAGGDTMSSSQVLRGPSQHIQGVTSFIKNAAMDPAGAVDSILTSPLCENITTPVNLFGRLSPRAQHAFKRLICTPLGSILLAMPSVARRALLFQGYSEHQLHTLSIVTLVMAVSGGTLNGIIWVFSDDLVREEWGIVLHCLSMKMYYLLTCDWEAYESVPGVLHGAEGFDRLGLRNSSFEGPPSEYNSVSMDEQGENVTHYNALVSAHGDNITNHQ